MDNVTLEKLKRTHGENAAEIFEKIRVLGGFGDVEPHYIGGLDIKGLPGGANKTKILALLGEETPEKETAESLAKNNNRKTLEKMAKDLGLDGNKYTDEIELAKAILNKKEGN